MGWFNWPLSVVIFNLGFKNHPTMTVIWDSTTGVLVSPFLKPNNIKQLKWAKINNGNIFLKLQLSTSWLIWIYDYGILKFLKFLHSYWFWCVIPKLKNGPHLAILLKAFYRHPVWIKHSYVKNGLLLGGFLVMLLYLTKWKFGEFLVS